MNWLALARVVGAAVALVAAFFFGWDYRNGSAEAEVSGLKLAYEEQRRSADKAAADELAEAEARNRKLSADFGERVRLLQSRSYLIQTEIHRAQKIASPSVCLSDGWVRLYNAALRTASDSSDAERGIAAPASGTDVSYSVPSGLSEWDALRVHAANAERWAECRSQLNSLIDFLRDDGAVVTSK